LRQDNARLRHELRERDKQSRLFSQTRKPGQGQRTENEDLPPIPPPFSPMHSHSTPLGTQVEPPPHINHYNSEGLYRPNDDHSAALCNGSYSTSHNHSYTGHSPSMPYVGPNHEHVSGDGSSHAMTAHRGPPKYSPYHYPIPGSNRESPWPQPLHAASGSESGPPTSTNSSSHSPNFAESPTLTSSDMSYVGRFPVEDQKVPLSSMDSTPYIFPSSRSISPSSTPSSSSSTSLTSPFQFAFSENSISHDRPEFDYRRQSNHPHGAEVTLHGGTADISLAGPCDAVRYRLGTRRANSGPERALLPTLPPISGHDNGDRGSSESELYSHHSRPRPRRVASSRSPSPVLGCPPISGTLAVIKAQAFGALRRTRARTKRTSEGAAKVAMDVLEARGIGMGVSAPTGSKRPRLQDDEGDTQP
jgi:hypothetical protein